MGMGKAKGKMKKGWRDEEKPDPENIAPQPSEIRTAGPGEYGPFHVP